MTKIVVPCAQGLSMPWRVLGLRILMSAVVASIVGLSSLLWSPAELVASAVSAHFEGVDGMPYGTKKALREVAIVKITETHFQSGYGSRSPLDRCILASDLEQLFALTTLTVVAVDFDLAPYRLPQGTDHECQVKLNAVLDNFPRKAEPQAQPPLLNRSLILMQPMPRSETLAGLKAMVNEWQTERATKGIEFAHVELRRKSGAAREFVERQDGQLALGLAFRDALHKASYEASQKASQQVFPEDLLGDAQLKPADLPTYPPRQIAVRGTEALYRMGDEVALDQLCRTDNDIKVCIDLKAAIVGSGYSVDDRHATMGGMRDGVDLHAAIAACPKAGVSHFQHFVLDIVLGVFLGWVFSLQWKRYYETVSGTRQREWTEWSRRPAGRLACLGWWATPRRSETAYGWFGWMLAFSVMAMVLVCWLSLQLFGGACATAIFPAGIVVGMFIEAAVVQGPETAAHLMQHATTHHENAALGANTAAPAPSRDWHAIFKLVLALVFSLGTGVYLWFH